MPVKKEIDFYNGIDSSCWEPEILMKSPDSTSTVIDSPNQGLCITARINSYDYREIGGSYTPTKQLRQFGSPLYILDEEIRLAANTGMRLSVTISDFLRLKGLGCLAVCAIALKAEPLTWMPGANFTPLQSKGVSHASTAITNQIEHFLCGLVFHWWITGKILTNCSPKVTRTTLSTDPMHVWLTPGIGVTPEPSTRHFGNKFSFDPQAWDRCLTCQSSNA